MCCQNASHQHKQVSFRPEVEERINKLDVKPSYVPRDNHTKQKQGTTMMMWQIE
jgi:hypothetical protein